MNYARQKRKFQVLLAWAWVVMVTSAAVFIVLLAYTSDANAVTAFKTGEKVTGQTKQCYYQFAGNEYTITIKSYQLCPLSIEVD